MQAILFALSSVGEFIISETGFVKQRSGLPLSWTAGVLMTAAILFGGSGKAEAVCASAWDCAGQGGSYCPTNCQIDCGTANSACADPYGSSGRSRCVCYP